MNLKIQRLNGDNFNLIDYGIKTLNFTVDSPSPRTTTEVIEGRNGYIDMGTVYDGRTLRGSFFMTSVDGYDTPLLRNEIFKIFESKELFYLIDTREEGKRWKVKCDGKFSLEQILANKGRFEVKFISHSSFSESVGTTLDPFTFNSEVWQVGQGLTVDVDETDFTHNTTSFSIFNAGDKDIDPRELPIIITYKGASTNLQIDNVTTKETWSYTGETISTDVIELNGIRSLKNDTSIFKNTNRKLITVKKGWNDFQLSGTSGDFTIEFNFRFYYL